jgi:hypothetical protein
LQHFKEPITSGSAKQDGNEIEHPTDFVRYKHAFIEEEGADRVSDEMVPAVVAESHQTLSNER